MNKQITLFIVIVVAASGLSFYGGIKYNQTQSVAERTANRAQFGGGNNSSGNGTRVPRGGANGGFTAGEVIAKDDKSVTIKLRDGGSKIIFLSASAEVTKSATGSAQDISIGTQVSANGTANSDGSMTAQTVQIRPGLLNNQQ
jgi:hypothetical protein